MDLSDEEVADNTTNVDDTDGEGTDENLSVDRRDYLRLTASATAVAGAGALATGSAAAQAVDGIEFDAEVNLVEDFGADDTGSEPVDDALDRAIQADTLVRVPEGRYLVHRKHLIPGGSNVGFVGDGDVQFVPRQGSNFRMFDSSTNDPVNRVLFKHIDFDIRADNTVTGLRFNTENGIHVEDVEYIGRGIHEETEVVNGITVTIANPDATGVLKDFVSTKGSSWARYKVGDGRSGISVFPPHRGTLRVVDPHLEEFGNNAMYSSRHEGRVQVEGGVFRNNNVAAVRISGEGNWVEGAYIEVDPDSYTGPREDEYERTAFMMRGVRVEANGFDKTPGAAVRNCDFVFREAPGIGSAVEVESNAKTVTVSDSRIRYDADEMAAIQSEPNGYPVELDGVSITGSSAGGTAVRTPDSPNTRIQNCCIQQTGDGRNGIRITDSDSCSVTDTNVTVDGEALSVSNSEVDTTNVTQGGTCPAPTTGGSDSDSGTSTDDSMDSGTDDGTDTDSGTSTDDSTDGGTDEQWPVDRTADDAAPRSGVLEFRVVDGGPLVNYEFTVDGDVMPRPDAGDASTESNDELVDNGDGTVTVTGATGNGYADSYRIDGALTSFQVDHAADQFDLRFDGTTLSLDELFAPAENETGTAGPSVLRVSTPDGGPLVQYEFTVDGDVALRPDAGDASTESNDELVDNGDGTVTVTGATGNGYADSYQLTDWRVTEFVTDAADGDLSLLLDGEPITVAELTGQDDETDSGTGDDGSDSDSDGSQLANTLVVDGSRFGRTEYAFSVSGDLEPADDVAGLESTDSIDGSTANGIVDGEVDAFRFSGDIESFQLDGYATIRLDEGN